jgi:hypothetical protein
MKTLGRRNYELIRFGVSIEGTYNPDKVFYAFEEQLYVRDVDTIYNFLKWVHQNGKTFGSGNYEQVFQEYKSKI